MKNDPSNLWRDNEDHDGVRDYVSGEIRVYADQECIVVA